MSQIKLNSPKWLSLRSLAISVFSDYELKCWHADHISSQATNFFRKTIPSKTTGKTTQCNETEGKRSEKRMKMGKQIKRKD